MKKVCIKPEESHFLKFSNSLINQIRSVSMMKIIPYFGKSKTYGSYFLAEVTTIYISMVYYM